MGDDMVSLLTNPRQTQFIWKSKAYKCLPVLYFCIKMLLGARQWATILGEISLMDADTLFLTCAHLMLKYIGYVSIHGRK